MNHLQEYIGELTQAIDAAESEDEALRLVDALDLVASTLRNIRLSLPRDTDTDLAAALDNDLEHWEATAAIESKRASSVADEIVQQEEDDRIYGTYEQQVRSQYYGGVL